MADRDWLIMADEYENDQAFRDAVVDELARLENMGFRTGGAYVVTPLRARLDEQRVNGVDEFVTVGWLFRQTFAPAVKTPPVARQVAPAPEPEMAPLLGDELEAVLAGGEAA